MAHHQRTQIRLWKRIHLQTFINNLKFFLFTLKNILIDSVDMRMVFKEYLQTVVGQEREERNRYVNENEFEELYISHVNN